MNKSKSLIVTILFAVMLAAIDMGLLKIWIPGFGIITGALAALGFWRLAEIFAGWLQGVNDDIDPLELPSLKDVVATIPAADVRPVVRGHWISEEEAEEKGDYSLRDACSVCGHCDWDCTESAGFNYCPNCGADMRPTSMPGANGEEN